MKIDFELETEFQEFKTSMAELDKGIMTIAAMLNKHGKGKVCFGVSDHGDVVVLEAEGDRRPYASFGEYRIRVGSENKKIDPEEPGDLFLTNAALTADIGGWIKKVDI